jgi:4-amino-4-deoxy-L-arabinose transferase-like glycosyltransferase
MTFIRKFFDFYRHYPLLLSAIIAVIILRAVLLLITPPGFYLDEAAGGAHVLSLLVHGSNANGESWPLFSSSLGGGYTTPIYLYPLTLWSFLFGTSEYALRAFSLFATIIASLLIALAIRIWLGNKAALIAALSALLLPWSLVQGSVAWDPALVPVFIAGSLYGFSVALTTTSSRRQLVAAAATGASLVALAYLYPPCRVTAPLLLVVMYGVLLYQKKLAMKPTLGIALALSILCAPLLLFMIQPEALHRSAELSVFHNTTIGEGLTKILINFTAMLNPIFLFITGDSNLRHATGQQGMLGLAALPPLLMLLFIGTQRLLVLRETRRLVVTPIVSLISIACAGIILSILGSALTAEGQPHSLRATAAWPFFIILITIGWVKLLSLPRLWLRRSAVAVAILATGWYLVDFAFYYPQRSAAAFDVPVRQAIEDHRSTAGYPALAQYYYDHK